MKNLSLIRGVAFGERGIIKGRLLYKTVYACGLFIDKALQIFVVLENLSSSDSEIILSKRCVM